MYKRGFLQWYRNYLEHVATDISEWTRDEEAKHQAKLLAAEVENIHKHAEEEASRAASAIEKAKGKPERGKSPKKSPSRFKHSEFLLKFH